MKDVYKMYRLDNEDVGELLKVVSTKKVYFGHRSVGHEILLGMQQWEVETGVQLQKAESSDFSSVSDVPFVHFRIETNSDPKSKIDAFVALMEQIPAEERAIAFFILSHTDINACTVVDVVFDYYKENMLQLKELYPNVRFVACTVPLMGIQKGIKAIVKKMIGRQPAGLLGNVNRNKFNTRLKNELSGTFPVFDIGGIESTAPNGSPVSHSFSGNKYPCMYRKYTHDLRHLTDFGARTLSYNLLAFLAKEV